MRRLRINEKLGIIVGPKFMDKTADKTEEKFGYPLRIPICFNNIKLGNIKIDLEPNKKELDTPQKRRFYMTAIAELFFSSPLLKEEIELRIRTHEKDLSSGKMNPYIGLLLYFFWYPEQTFELYYYLLSKDEDIFEIIKSEGPISLRSSSVQRRINEWLSDKKIAGNRINKLRNSLLEYALGSKDKRLLNGRSKIEVIRRFGTKWIKEMHFDIMSTLNIVKKNRENYPTYKIYQLIEEAHKEFLLSMKKELEKGPDSKEVKGKLRRIKFILNNYKNPKLPNPIAESIENDENLREEFNKFKWAPYDMAIKVVAKLSDASYQKIKDILYRK